MKKRIMSAGLVLVVLISLAACGTSSAASGIETVSSAVAESEVETTAEPNPWFNKEAYNKRMEAAGVAYKLNDDGTKPEEWTPEFYEGEEYAECDGSEFRKATYYIYQTLNPTNIDYEKFIFPDSLPEEQYWAMSEADFKRAAPEIAPPTDEDFNRFKEEAQRYIESRGAGEYPIVFRGYWLWDKMSTDSIRVMFCFWNETPPQNDGSVGTFTCRYSTKDYANQGYMWFAEGLDTAYGDGTYQAIHDKLVGKDAAESTATSMS